MSPLLSVAAAAANGNVEIHCGYNKGVGFSSTDYNGHLMKSYFGEYDKSMMMIRQTIPAGTTSMRIGTMERS